MGLIRSAVSCVVAIVAALIALPASVATVPVASPVTTYTYDAPIYDAPGNDSVQERGPPRVAVAHTTYDAVNRLSHGGLTRSEVPSTPSFTADLYNGALAQGARPTTTTARRAVLADGDIAAPQRSGVAANTATSLAVTDLNAGQLAHLTRYTSKFPATAEGTVITAGENGVVTFTTRVPGRVPGSSATYAKTVDEAGTTIGYVKTTIAPDGTVVSVKDKLVG